MASAPPRNMEGAAATTVSLAPAVSQWAREISSALHATYTVTIWDHFPIRTHLRHLYCGDLDSGMLAFGTTEGAMSDAPTHHQRRIRLFDEEVMDRDAIVEILSRIHSSGAPVFITDPATGDSFLGHVLNVDDGRSAFTIGRIIPEGSLSAAGSGDALQLLSPEEDADFAFESFRFRAGEQSDGWCELAFPARLHRMRRRREYRGPGFGLAEVYLQRKDAPKSAARKLMLRDISDGGIGIFLPEPPEPDLEPGVVFDDCLLLLNGNPVAACTIEIRHVREETEPSGTIAGGRFLDLDAVSQKRISMLVTTVQCEEIKRSRGPASAHKDARA
jgi:c-di-GMP-binding flagellar brake protein YcgR